MYIVTLNGIEYSAVNPKLKSVFDYVEIISADNLDVLGYRVLENIAYYSKRYKRWIGVEAKDKSDGATCAPDIDSFCWLFHDELCNDGAFEDGTECNNWQASSVLSDILKQEGRWFRARTWFTATWIGGGGKARENGMF